MYHIVTIKHTNNVKYIFTLYSNNSTKRGESLLHKMKDKKAMKRRQLMYLEIQRECDRYEDECIYLGWHYETTEERNQRLKEKEMKEKEKLHWQLHI